MISKHKRPRFIVEASVPIQCLSLCLCVLCVSVLFLRRYLPRRRRRPRASLETLDDVLARGAGGVGGVGEERPAVLAGRAARAADAHKGALAGESARPSVVAFAAVR
jgi:hypothetical protein